MTDRVPHLQTGDKLGTVMITLPLPDRRLHAHSKGHWRNKSGPTAKARWDAYAAALPYRRQAFERAVVTLRFYWPDRRRRDALNAAQSAKPYIDGIVDAGVLRDDSWEVLSVGGIECGVDRNNPRVEIVLHERSGT